MTSNFDGQPTFENFHLRVSIWEEIEKLTHFNYNEQSTIKKVIGESVVDETLDLHVEVKTLYEIWSEYHQSITQQICQPVLPEPPLLRENLEKQITMLVDLLQKKVSRQGGRPLTAVLTDEERDMVKSVSKEQCKFPPATASPTEDCMSARRSSSAMSLDVDRLKEGLNLYNIDQIIQLLRNDFEEERKSLLKDIEIIQNGMILENENSYQLASQCNSPTIKDLRELGSKLEKEVLSKKKHSIEPVLLSHELEEDNMNLVSTKRFNKFSPSPPSTATNNNQRKHSSHNHRKLVAATKFSFADANNNNIKHSPSPPLLGKLVTKSPIKQTLDKYKVGKT